MKNYYKIDLISISQTSGGTGGVYTGKITFEQLFRIHRLTERKESKQDPFGTKKINYKKEEDEEFQRHLSEKKLTEIRNYVSEHLISEKATIFPSAVIISLELNENNSEDFLEEQQIDHYYSQELGTCFILQNSQSPQFKKLYIPKNERICLIVDGQHRFYGLRKYYESIKNEEIRDRIKKFEFITTVLLGLDAYQVGQVFANVNFHQKPVNRSLYYDIFGASSTDKNEIQLAHYLALHMQNNTDSPLKDMIKLLGKGYGLFSQAFIVEKLIIHFGRDGVWRALYEDFKSSGRRFLEIPLFMKSYFRAIEHHYDLCWPRRVIRDGHEVYSSFSYDYILCKTTGMGAFLRLIKDIFPLVEKMSETQKMAKLDSIFSRISKKDAAIMFSKTGDYGGAGSEGLQLRLYRSLKYKYKLEASS